MKRKHLSYDSDNLRSFTNSVITFHYRKEKKEKKN